MMADLKCSGMLLTQVNSINQSSSNQGHSLEIQTNVHVLVTTNGHNLTVIHYE